MNSTKDFKETRCSNCAEKLLLTTLDIKSKISRSKRMRIIFIIIWFFKNDIYIFFFFILFQAIQVRKKWAQVGNWNAPIASTSLCQETGMAVHARFIELKVYELFCFKNYSHFYIKQNCYTTFSYSILYMVLQYKIFQLLTSQKTLLNFSGGSSAKLYI